MLQFYNMLCVTIINNHKIVLKTRLPFYCKIDVISLGPGMQVPQCELHIENMTQTAMIMIHLGQHTLAGALEMKAAYTLFYI